MTDQPKRRGRPPKVREPAPAWADDPWSATRDPFPTPRLRHKPGVGLQQAWAHHDGVQWRPVPVVAPDAPDWEDS